MLVIASCSSSRWQTDEIDNPTTEPERIYERDGEGIAESIADMLVDVPVNLNYWAPAEDEAACVGTGLVEAIGAERLLSLGFEPQAPSLALAYTADEAVAAQKVMTDCIDFEQTFVELFTAYGKLAPETARCVSRGFHSKNVDDAFAASTLQGRELDSFGDDAAIAAAIGETLAACFTDNDLPNLATTSTFPEDRPTQ